MTKAFNLLDEPWLPVRWRDGRIQELGLLDLFANASQISELAETSPPNLVALYRMLLAIVQRALIGSLRSWKIKDRTAWLHGGLPSENIQAYLQQQRERFWLFHPEHPFMQVPVLASAEATREKSKPWTQIALDSANGNTPVMFDHSLDTAPTPITPAQALRHLLGYLQFTPGGLVKCLRDSDKAGPLANTAAIIPVGHTLAQTLCLALCPVTDTSVSDLAAWERPAPSIAELSGEPVLAAGPNDRYTRLTRAVLLLRNENGMVSTLRFAAGLALAEDPHAPDAMASYRVHEKGVVRLTFNEGRAIWRDLSTLLPDAEGKTAKRAAVLEWATSLKDEDEGHQLLLVAGLASDQAKLLRWRCERLNLPVALLTSPGAADQLRQELLRCQGLYESLRAIAAEMLAHTMPQPQHKETRARARDEIKSGPCATAFFSTAESYLPALYQDLAAGQSELAHASWGRALIAAAEAGWAAVLNGMGNSGLAICAVGKLSGRFQQLLNTLRTDNPQPHASAEVSL